MAQAPTTEQVDVATQAWIAEWRRAWVRRNPGKESPVLPWESYSPGEQHVMTRAVKAALVAAQPENVRAALERREA